MFCLKIATLVIQFKWFITKLTHFILFFVSFWIALQKTWYYQKIVKGTRIKLRAHLSNKALIKFHSVLWYLKFVHATFQVCLYGLRVCKIEILSKLNKIQTQTLVTLLLIKKVSYRHKFIFSWIIPNSKYNTLNLNVVSLNIALGGFASTFATQVKVLEY